MNNKIIAAVIVVLVIVGAALLLTNKTTKQTTTNTESTNNTNQAQDGSGSKEQAATITVTANGYEPQKLTVAVGTRVTWINKSGKVVTVHSDNHPTHLLYPPINLGEFKDGFSVQVVFDKAGTYGYHNHLNPTMKGTVVVK